MAPTKKSTSNDKRKRNEKANDADGVFRSESSKKHLVRWDVSCDQLLLLSIEKVCREEYTSFPWDTVAGYVDDNVTGNAVEQHLGKMRKRRIASGDPVPPKVQAPRKKVIEKSHVVDGRIVKLWVNPNPKSRPRRKPVSVDFPKPSGLDVHTTAEAPSNHEIVDTAEQSVTPTTSIQFRTLDTSNEPKTSETPVKPNAKAMPHKTSPLIDRGLGKRAATHRRYYNEGCGDDDPSDSFGSDVEDDHGDPAFTKNYKTSGRSLGIKQEPSASPINPAGNPLVFQSIESEEQSRPTETAWRSAANYGEYDSDAEGDYDSDAEGDQDNDVEGDRDSASDCDHDSGVCGESDSDADDESDHERNANIEADNETQGQENRKKSLIVTLELDPELLGREQIRISSPSQIIEDNRSGPPEPISSSLRRTSATNLYHPTSIVTNSSYVDNNFDSNMLAPASTPLPDNVSIQTYSQNITFSSPEYYVMADPGSSASSYYGSGCGVFGNTLYHQHHMPQGTRGLPQWYSARHGPIHNTISNFPSNTTYTYSSPPQATDMKHRFNEVPTQIFGTYSQSNSYDSTIQTSMSSYDMEDHDQHEKYTLNNQDRALLPYPNSPQAFTFPPSPGPFLTERLNDEFYRTNRGISPSRLNISFNAGYHHAARTQFSETLDTHVSSAPIYNNPRADYVYDPLPVNDADHVHPSSIYSSTDAITHRSSYGDFV